MNHLSASETTATCSIRLTQSCPPPLGGKLLACEASQGERFNQPQKNSHLSASFWISSSTSNFTTQRRRNRFKPFFSSLSGVGRTICSSISPWINLQENQRKYLILETDALKHLKCFKGKLFLLRSVRIHVHMCSTLPVLTKDIPLRIAEIIQLRNSAPFSMRRGTNRH